MPFFLGLFVFLAFMAFSFFNVSNVFNPSDADSSI